MAKEDDDEPGENETPPEDDPPQSEGLDEGGGSITEQVPEQIDIPEPPMMEEPAPEEEPDSIGEDAHLIATLSEIAKAEGISIHVMPGMTLKNYCEHLCTSFKTLQAARTKEAADENLNQPAQQPQQPKKPMQPQQQEPQEPEYAESPPIMMSATTEHDPRLVKSLKKQVAMEKSGQHTRVAALYSGGYIDAAIRKDLDEAIDGEVIKLSMFDDDLNLPPSSVNAQIVAYERLMKSGKPGSFARPTNKPAGPKPYNPNKPISTADSMQLSGAETVVEIPDDDRGDAADAPAHPDIVVKLSGGMLSKKDPRYKELQETYDAYHAKNGRR